MIKIRSIVLVLVLFGCRSQAQPQTSVDSIFSAIHTAAMMKVNSMPPGFTNKGLYQDLLEDRFEEIAATAFAAHTNDKDFGPFMTRWMEHDSARREKINAMVPELLAHGSAQELKASSAILARRQVGGDTSDFWNAYQLAARAVMLGDSSAQKIADISLGEYISKNGKRINADSVKRSWNTSGSNDESDLKWLTSYSDALAEAKRTKGNIFIDFTGYTDGNCRAMESMILSRPDVQGLFRNFVLVRLYTDNGDPDNAANATMEESRFQTIALPYYAIVSPDDKPLATFPGFTRDAEAFKAFLKLSPKYRWKK